MYARNYVNMPTYMCRVHGMEFIAMKIDVEAHVFASLKYATRRVQIEHTFLTKYINVVHLQIT